MEDLFKINKIVTIKKIINTLKINFHLKQPFKKYSNLFLNC